MLEYRRRGIEELPPLPEIEGVTGRIVSSVAARAIEPSPSRSRSTSPSNADRSADGLIRRYDAFPIAVTPSCDDVPA